MLVYMIELIFNELTEITVLFMESWLVSYYSLHCHDYCEYEVNEKW